MRKRYLLPLLLLLVTLPVGAEDSAQRTMHRFREMGIPFFRGHELTLLPTAQTKFDSLFHDIEKAREYILLDYFKFQQDSICGLLLERLREKAREGVSVYIIFDSFGNKNSELPLSDTLQARIRADGIHIAAFDPVRFPWINHLLHRNHHKIAVIDGRIVYTGGMNVAGYYLHGKPKVGRWRDMHIRMAGPIALAYEELFWKMWHKGQGARSEEQGTRSKEQGARSKEQENTDRHNNPLAPCPSADIAFASRWPKESPRIMRWTYSTCIDNAERLVQIVNPYAMLFGEVRAALRRALERGVRVQFMVSTKSDGKVNDDVVGLEMRKLMKRGAEVYYYDDGFHHSKVMMIDSLFCTVGTTNLDARSLCFDYEVNAFVFDSTTTHALQRIFANDMAHSTLLTPQTSQSRFPKGRRLRSHVFAILKRFL